jgi:predicted RNase H-like nuclease (RuvC/YqgF family)
MWSKVVEYGKLILSIVQKQKQQEEDLKELRQDVTRLREEFRDLARVVERLAYEIQRDRDRSEADRRILLLEIENRFLRYERELPSSERKDETPE